MQVRQGEPRFNRDREVVDGVVDDPLKCAAAEDIGGCLDRRPPVQAAPHATGHPGDCILMPLAHQIDQRIACGRGMIHGTMVP